MLNDLLMNNNNLFNVRDMLVADVPASERQTQSNIGDVVAYSLTALNGDAPLNTKNTFFLMGADATASNVNVSFTNLTVRGDLINFGTITTQNMTANKRFSVFNANLGTDVTVKNFKLGLSSENTGLEYSESLAVNLHNIEAHQLNAGYKVQGAEIQTDEGETVLGNICYNGAWCEVFVAGPVYYLFHNETGPTLQKLPVQILIGYNTNNQFYVDGVNVANILSDFTVRTNNTGDLY
jgi:hypothetical protein